MTPAIALVLAAAIGPDADAPRRWSSELAVARCDAAPMQMPQDSARALDAVLLVRVPEGHGSGVLISDDGFALTAAHVVRGRTEVVVVRHDGNEGRAAVVRIDHAQDVALLHIEHETATPCLGLASDDAPLGADVYVLGSPGAEELSFSVAKGVVSGRRRFDGAGFLQLDASVNPGNSGGPAVDGHGRVVGIASWKVSHVAMEGLAFAVPADVAITSLGVTLGASSDPDWADKRGQRGDAPTAKTARVAPPVPGSTFDTGALRRKNARRILIASGAASIGGGAIVVGMTYLAYRVARTLDTATERGWRLQRGFNTAGWGLVIGGGVALVTGLAIPKRAKRKSSTDTAVTFTGTGLAVQGRF